MFQGFTDAFFEFFMALRFNNNREFFQQNRAWYEEAVKLPMRVLLKDLADELLKVDPQLDTRPLRAVSRINRDIRFSKNKAPYRDHMWISLRRHADTPQPEFVFIVDDSGAKYGMGFYGEHRLLMDHIRQLLLKNPNRLRPLLNYEKTGFEMEAHRFKRFKIPDDLPDQYKDFYLMRSFWLQQSILDFDLLRSPLLVNTLLDGYKQLSPLYLLLQKLMAESTPKEG